MKDLKDFEVVFVPGCFDSFEGTQDELNELVATIKNMIFTGELFENSIPVEEIDDYLTDKDYQLMDDFLKNDNSNRKLN